ncbi:hypothetical protein A2631_05500 [Candidatus Daviesbacteria bacterium RIFCSPHIGHO2_01_FULL_44_29]|uniref:Peptidase A2 domain-containing protein n=1 Tax=Candidatus Daviesbacteria bacterium RIFCSPHIGHO2_02_FULL_43_12 TaxID=1797776 RepID=A0A1F5KIG2_9BACT|nr:MAG: hypothetical protein A2631_05500 [Candidatus Daviesbacteria bacterium RIFCSPHIGHO2_01_FULL_44_29]OGE39203.1 MAG: hypothetical protein A3E86_01245 [Candidatus Daviesbacteria bacterium RIFCSPHIGHO2_12_FULL_47_45]OGE40595.1 MAG: hypothetical protein A3D25_00565 [Candidatus Daviesbacteria bacterium RIFCSPHIGHO2_02_FULL_43_12]OGE70155.1 MAG: hypothetical protein A3B55_00335 [Candidatus Daviesbacteria bacterium RIFCSPLOWO2_01_FULL_43_15]
MIVFEYRADKFGQKRPLVDLHLKTRSGEWTTIHPFIDSGADVSLIPLSIGHLVGLSSIGKKVRRIGGISGGIPVIYTTIWTKIGKTELQAEVAWAQIENVPTLLGRRDFFDKFHITFKQNEGKIIFSIAAN